MKVVVVDDHSLFRTGVVQSLMLDPEIEIVGEGASGADALDLTKRHSPDLVLLDISMPGNGIDACQQIVALPNPPRVVMLTVSEDDDDLLRALEAGAVGYLLKGIKALDLIGAVRSVAEGDSFVSPNLALRLLSVARKRPKGSRLESLSPQEERTLRLVAEGLSNSDIGKQLAINEKTVKFHMTNLMKKLNVKNRVEAVLVAQEDWARRPR